MVSALLLSPFPQRRLSFKNLAETTLRRNRLYSLHDMVYPWIDFIQLCSTVKFTRNLIFSLCLGLWFVGVFAFTTKLIFFLNKNFMHGFSKRHMHSWQNVF